MIDFTLVCGVDKKHLEQLKTVYPTWVKNKPILATVKLLLFFDRNELSYSEVFEAVPHPLLATYVAWPPEEGIVYPGNPKEKWTHPQRYKMLAGFVHTSRYITTPYWLKLDTDVVASEKGDWPKSEWFERSPAIVSHPWSFTRPPNQIMILDQWARECQIIIPEFNSTDSLNLFPKPDADRVGHKRIISWCAFFNTEFTNTCSQIAERTCGKYKLPIPSQDTFHWYCAKRMGLEIKRTSMKKLGWNQWLSNRKIKETAKLAIED